MTNLTIWLPTQQQCWEITDRGILKNPSMTDLYNNALDLLLNQSIIYRDGHWRCLSQSNPAISYAQSETGCTCPAYAKNFYQSGRLTLCKHRVAFFAYTTLIHEELNRRLLNQYPYGTQIRLLREHPQTFLYLDPSVEGLYTSYHVNGQSYRCSVCAIQAHSKTGLPRLINHEQLSIFANWLAAAAQPLPKTIVNEGMILLPKAA